MARKEKGAVVVTGASTGIGRATALHLDELGYRVFAGIRKQRDAKGLRKEGSQRLAPISIDVTKRRSIAAARAKVQRAVGRSGLTALVNNAGIASAGPVEHLAVEEFRRVVETNLIGQYAVTQEFLPLIRRGQGTIVFNTSIGGRVATPFMSPYNASKFGLEALADSLRRELKPWEIDVVVVEPGSIATPIWEKGVENYQRAEANFGREAKRLYGKQIEAMVEASRETAERGIEPEAVAKVIGRAIKRRRPRTRYLVGIDAKIMRRVSSVLSDRMADRAIRRSMKLPDEAPPAR